MYGFPSTDSGFVNHKLLDLQYIPQLFSTPFIGIIDKVIGVAMLKYSFFVLVMTSFLVSNSYAFVKCINDKGEAAFTNTICPEGYKAVKEYKEIKEPVSTATSSVPKNQKQVDAQKIIDNIKLRVLKKKVVSKKEADDLPKKGYKFLALLIHIANRNDNITIYGGISSNFTLKTSDGFTTNMMATSSHRWKESINIWTGIDLVPNDQNKGWIVFEISENSNPTKLYFHVAKVNSVHNLTGLGDLVIDF